jgi:hypothetical protein
VTVLVHPINTEAHPSTPPGFRWAVYVGDGSWADMGRCANAGWCPTQGEAAMEGEMVGVCAAKVARVFGVPVEYAVVTLDHDPIPTGGDFINVDLGA